MTYTRNELVTELSTKLNVSAEQGKKIVEEVLGCLTRAFQREDKVTFRDFGIFTVKTRKAKTGRNPKQPDVVVNIPAKRVVRFKAGKDLNALLNPAAA